MTIRSWLLALALAACKSEPAASLDAPMPSPDAPAPDGSRLDAAVDVAGDAEVCPLANALGGCIHQISGGVESSQRPSLVRSGDELGLAWVDLGAAGRGLYLTRLSSQGSTLGQLHVSSRSAFNNSLITTPDGYAIGWEGDTSDIYFSKVDALATAATSEVLVSAPNRTSAGPALAWNGNGYAMAWTDSGVSNAEIYFARLDPAGATLGSIVNLTNDAARSWQAQLVSTGTQLGLAWLSDSTIRFALLDVDGTLLTTPIAVSDTGFASAPRLVWTGTEFAVAWEQGTTQYGAREIELARISAAGVRQGNVVQVSDSPSAWSQGASLAWTGSHYLVAWQETVGSAWELETATVDPAGAVATATVDVTDLHGVPASPEIAATGAGTMLAWQAPATASVWNIYATALP